MRLTFAHGWGLDASLWKEIVEDLTLPYELIEFGFLGGSPQLDITGDIAIGHSFGLLWLLTQKRDWRAALSINGFTCFQQSPDFPEGHPKRVLERMKTALQTNPNQCLQDFYTQISLETSPTEVNPDQLLWGLEQLQTLDARTTSCPILALTAADDPLISRDMAHACFQRPTEIEKGGHVLPLMKAQYCREQLMNTF